MTLRRSTFAVPGAALLALGALGLPAAGTSAQESPDIERGKAVYEYWCAPCHAPGPGHPGTQSLQIKYDGALPAVLLERTDLPAETIKTFVREGILMMAPFRKTEITDAELDELAAYLTQE